MLMRQIKQKNSIETFISVIYERNILLNASSSIDSFQVFEEYRGKGFRLHSSQGLWIDECGAVFVADAVSKDKFIWCVETAWRASLIVIVLFPTSKQNGIFAQNIQEEADTLQDCINKIDLLIFPDMGTKQEFLRAGFTIKGKAIVMPQANYVTPYSSSKLPIFPDYIKFDVAADFLDEIEAHKDENTHAAFGESKKPIYVDVSLIARAGESELNGIPKVELEYYAHLMNINEGNLIFVRFHPAAHRYVGLDGASDGTLLEAASTLCNGRCEKFDGSIQNGSILFVLNIDWMLDRTYLDYLNSLCVTYDLRIIHIIYDFFYQNFPFWKFSSALNDINDLFKLCYIVSGVITISNFVKMELLKFLQKEERSVPPIKIVRLGDKSDLNLNVRIKRTPEQFCHDYPKPFILMVANNGYHKNHILIYNIISRLLKQHPHNKIPHFIAVGSVYCQNVFWEAIKNDTFTASHLHLYSNIPDNELDYLYDNCLFSVYPSLHEGWGLPVAESLVHGKLCISSNSASMPEIAPGIADYIDPFDFVAWYERISEYIFNPLKLKEREKEIAESYKHYSWQQSAVSLKSLIISANGRRAQAPILSLGSNWSFRNTGYQEWWHALGEGIICDSTNGIKLTSASGLLRFRIRNFEGNETLSISIYGHAPKGETIPLQIRVNNSIRSFLLLRPGRGNIRLTLKNDDIGQEVFGAIDLEFINPDAAVRPWDYAAAAPYGIFLLDMVLYPAAEIERREAEVLETIDRMLPHVSPIFSGLLQDRLDQPQYVSIERDALALIFRVWLECADTDYRVAGLRKEFLRFFRNLAETRHEFSKIPEYTTLVHALHVAFGKDGDMCSPQGQRAILESVKRYQNQILQCDWAALERIGYIAGASVLKLETLCKHASSKNGLVRLEDLHLLSGMDACPGEENIEPGLYKTTSQLVTYSQFQSAYYYQGCADLGERPDIDRQQWQKVFILRSLHGHLKDVRDGIYVGPGESSLVKTLQRGCGQLEQITDFSGAESLVKLQRLHKSQYKFLCSLGAANFVDSVEMGIEFLRISASLLKHGGVAVHIMEVNLGEWAYSTMGEGQVIFAKRDISRLVSDDSIEVKPVNWCFGVSPDDNFVQINQENANKAIKYINHGRIASSLGIIIIKK